MNNQKPIIFDDIPGDKSITHRALIFTALTGKTNSRDHTELMLAHLPFDRRQAFRENLLKLGVSIQGHVITGSKEFTPAKLNHFHDHRILMSFEMLNLAQPNVASFSANEVQKISYPQFYRDLDLF